MKPKDIIKRVLIILGIILLFGFIFQKVSNFIAKETLKDRVDYTRVDDKRLDYIVKGDGKYTVIFDGSIGGNLNQWNAVCDKLLSEYDDITVFVYNRRGYGFSDGGATRTPLDQANDLKILLRKAAAPSPYILVGEEYGSLILTNFAKEYKDTVAGVVLVNPLIEEQIKNKNFSKGIRFEKFRRKIEDFGSHIGLTTLLDKLNLDAKIKGFEDKIEGDELEEFKVHRTKSDYTSAVYNELGNITKGLSNSQEEGLFSGIPYYLIAKEGQESLQNLGDSALTKVYKTNCETNFISLEDPDSVIIGIRQVIKQVNDIERKNKKNN
ncbi:Putative hydrolase or acyltransferase of alpha/beta superfamily [Clostridium chauvoei JF4335]|nr:Putative hydrolase or acyltransferase of alpha/beta superfamily [Clostridium chauvoei JF4335]